MSYKSKSNPVRVFLSYSTKEKHFVAEYKKYLEIFGLKVFLAHQDITPSLRWQETILANITECDVFIPFISKQFHESFWTDQECGIAFYLEKIILPIKYPDNPYGFISRYQGLNGDSPPDTIVLETIEILVKHKVLKNRLREGLISSLKKGIDEDSADVILDAIVMLNPLSTRQIDEVVRRFLSNPTLLNTGLANRIGESLIVPNQTRISINVVKEFKTKTNW